MGSLLFWRKPENFEYTKQFIPLIEKCKTFIDVGANIGYYSILAGKLNPEIAVYAYEPAQGPFHFLNQNVSVNNLNHQIQPFQIALGKKSDTIDFYESINLKYSYLTHHLGGVGTTLKNNTFHPHKVRSETLDSIIQTNKILGVDLIKLDTEGTELEILEGCTHSINQFRPIVISEILFNKIEAQLETYFTALNYRMFYPLSDGLKEVKTIVRSKDDGVRNCFFIPQEQVHSLKDLIQIS
ncbi:MAG: FkbM family methyltransferase [Flammeovirgaceae bacterium]|nr:FkbM family methyltransferase [Flammeovirgaceae bacterium]